MKIIVGLAGYAQSGKDTLASYLVEDHGFTRVAFADKLRDALYILNPWVPPAGLELGEFHRLRVLVDSYGWEWVKLRSAEVRELLQRMGTEAGREIHGADCWVNAAMRQVDAEPDKRYVFTDVRFPSEADAITFRHGVVLKVDRPGTGPVNGHSSETALDDYPFPAVVYNDGTVEDLRKWADRIADREAAA